MQSAGRSLALSTARIAYQGEAGAFSEEAALRIAPQSSLVACASFAETFAAIPGRADLILAPIENAIAGPVGDSLDLLFDRVCCGSAGEASPSMRLYAIAQVQLPIHMNLIALPGTKIEEIRIIRSHPVALQQCRRFLSRVASQYGIAADPVYDTAGAVKQMAAQGDATVAAIASERAASLYGGVLLARDIEDDPRNATRFLLLSTFVQETNAATHAKLVQETNAATHALFVVPLQSADTLAAILLMAKQNNFRLTRLFARPWRGAAFQYRYAMEFALNAGDPQELESALRSIAPATAFAGSYDGTIQEEAR